MIRKVKPSIAYIVSDIDKAVFFELTADHLKGTCDLSFILINGENSELAKHLEKQQIPVDFISCTSLSRSFKAIRTTKKTLRERNIDLVHCHMAKANWIGLIAAKWAGIQQRIYTRHSGPALQPSFKERAIDRIQNKLATQIVAISKNIEKVLIDQKVPQHKIQLIYHGFDTDRFVNVDENEVQRIRSVYNAEGQWPVIGVIARWMEWKGIQYTLEAFIEFLKEYPDSKICLFGGMNGDYVSEIEKILEKIPERNKIIVPFENNVFELYDLFDIYAHVPVNEHCEAFGQTYVEAFLKKKACIFTKSGISSEFAIHLQNSYVVNYRNSAEILNGLLYFTQKEHKDNFLIDSELQLVADRFSMEKYVSKLQQLYGI